MQIVPGPGLSHRRHHHRPLRHPSGVRDRARKHHHPRADRVRGNPQGPPGDHRHRNPLSGEQEDPDGEASPNWCAARSIEGIGEMRDESDRSGMRIVIELKRDATPEVVLNQLFRFTQLQTSRSASTCWRWTTASQSRWGCARPCMCFIRFREEVILRRARFELGKARDRAHNLVGLAIAVANIDEVIRLIRASPDAAAARVALMGRDWPAEDIGALLALIDEPGNVIAPDGTVRLTEEQARGILELRLQRLTGLEREKIQAEMTEVAEQNSRTAGNPGLAHPPHGGDDRGADRGAQGDRFAADDRDRRRAGRPGRRKPDRAGPDGGHHHPRRLHQAHHAGDIPSAEPRRTRAQRRLERAATTSLPAASTPTRTNGCCSSRPAARRSGRRSGGCRKPGRRRRARALVNLLPELGRRHDHHGAAAAAGRNAVGQPASGIRHCVGQCAAQPAVGLPQRPRRRPDRDEAGRGRPPDRRRHVPRGRRRAAGDPQGPLHPLPAVRRPGAGVRRPRQLRRARHQAAERRRGHQPVGAAPCSGHAGRANRLPQAGERQAARQRRCGGRGAGSSRMARTTWPR